MARFFPLLIGIGACQGPADSDPIDTAMTPPDDMVEWSTRIPALQDHEAGIVIDGELEPVWDQALRVGIDVTDEGYEVTAHMLADDEALHIAFENVATTTEMRITRELLGLDASFAILLRVSDTAGLSTTWPPESNSPAEWPIAAIVR